MSVTFLTFLPALHNDFVDWDDASNFSHNPFYRRLRWRQLEWMWTTPTWAITSP
jgi:hypothetical protein